MSQMPDKIWLHKDTKYNTGDIVCGYQYDFAQGIEDEGIENFVEYVHVDAFIEKAEKWFFEHWREYVWLTDNNIIHFGHWKKDFREAMKG